jgi:hypothetical protein
MGDEKSIKKLMFVVPSKYENETKEEQLRRLAKLMELHGIRIVDDRGPSNDTRH